MSVSTDRLMAARVVIHHPDAVVELRGDMAIARCGPGGEYTEGTGAAMERMEAWKLLAIATGVFVIGYLAVVWMMH